MMVTITLLVQHKRRVKSGRTSGEQNEEAVHVATYEEIDELQQFSKCIATTKNMAYCDIKNFESQ